MPCGAEGPFSILTGMASRPALLLGLAVFLELTSCATVAPRPPSPPRARCPDQLARLPFPLAVVLKNLFAASDLAAIKVVYAPLLP